MICGKEQRSESKLLVNIKLLTACKVTPLCPLNLLPSEIQIIIIKSNFLILFHRIVFK